MVKTILQGGPVQWGWIRAAILLDFIAQTEVGRTDRASYDVIYGHNQGKVDKPITSMTLSELVDLQASFTRKFGSSAAGRYQFMRATLQDLARELGLKGTQRFDPNLQDRLGYHLLKRRGYLDFMAGRISRTEFGGRLAREWASLPVLTTTKGATRTVGRCGPRSELLCGGMGSTRRSSRQRRSRSSSPR
jgi:Muramidase (phage lambda lysozyme)